MSDKYVSLHSNHPPCRRLKRCPKDAPWPGRHHQINCPAWREESAAPFGSDLYIEDALKYLLDFVVSGRRYRRQNPYTILAVKAAIRAWEQRAAVEYQLAPGEGEETPDVGDVVNASKRKR